MKPSLMSNRPLHTCEYLQVTTFLCLLPLWDSVYVDALHILLSQYLQCYAEHAADIKKIFLN